MEVYNSGAARYKKIALSVWEMLSIGEFASPCDIFSSFSLPKCLFSSFLLP